MRRALWILTACVLGSGAPPTGAGEGGEGAAAKLPLVENESGKEVPIGPSAWKKLPRLKVKAKDHAGAVATFEGVSLAALLKEAGAKLGKELRGPALTTVVIVEARDGFRVAFALAEIDPDMTDNVVLLADRKDGKHFDTREGPYRFVVPHDKKHSRWVRQVTRIRLHRPAEPTALPKKE
jgi:hypothetical protein